MDITLSLIAKRAGVGQGKTVAMGSWQRTLTNIRNLPNTHDHQHTRIQHPHPRCMVDQPHPHKGPQVHAAHTGMGHRDMDRGTPLTIERAIVIVILVVLAFWALAHFA